MCNKWKGGWKSTDFYSTLLYLTNVNIFLWRNLNLFLFVLTLAIEENSRLPSSVAILHIQPDIIHSDGRRDKIIENYWIFKRLISLYFQVLRRKMSCQDKEQLVDYLESLIPCLSHSITGPEGPRSNESHWDTMIVPSSGTGDARCNAGFLFNPRTHSSEKTKVWQG